LLDNDAEGVDAYRKLQALNLPGNMRSMLMPDVDELRNFVARGPQGVSNCDINGRAAASVTLISISRITHPRRCYGAITKRKSMPGRELWSTRNPTRGISWIRRAGT
jgi:hypothetical protein